MTTHRLYIAMKSECVYRMSIVDKFPAAFRTSCRYDLQPANNGHYKTTTLFPCVHTSKRGGTRSAHLFQLVYSDEPSENQAEYTSFPLGNGTCWNIQTCLGTGDGNTIKAVIAALEGAAAVPNCYLSTDFPAHLTLKGCSLGLAVAACVLGLPAFAYTGWITGFGNETSEWTVGNVDGIDVKISHCRDIGMPIFVARQQLQENRQTRERCSLGRFYKFSDWMRGTPYSPVFEAIECGNIAEVVTMATSIGIQYALARINDSERIEVVSDEESESKRLCL